MGDLQDPLLCSDYRAINEEEIEAAQIKSTIATIEVMYNTIVQEKVMLE